MIHPAPLHSVNESSTSVGGATISEDIFGPAVKVDKGVFAGRWIRCGLQVAQEPVHGRRKTETDRRPLAPCPIVRLRVVECRRTNAYGGWSESEIDMSHIEASNLVCAADFHDTTPVHSPDQVQLQMSRSAGPSVAPSPVGQSATLQSPMSFAATIASSSSYSNSQSFGNTDAIPLPIPYQPPIPSDLTGQLAYASFNDYSDRSTASTSYPSPYGNVPAYPPQSTYIPPQFSYTTPQANYTTSSSNYQQLNYPVQPDYYPNPNHPNPNNPTNMSGYDTPRNTNSNSYPTPQNPYTPTYIDPTNLVPVSSPQARPPSSSSTGSFMSQFSPGEHPSHPYGQDTGMVGVFRPKYPREREGSEESMIGAGEGRSRGGRSGKKAKPVEKRGLFGNLHVQGVRVPAPDGTQGLWFLFTDLTVRNEGTYVLRFRVYDITAIDGGSTQPMTALAQCSSRPFKVFSPRNFPGLPKPTALAEHFGRQGFKLNTRKNERQIRTPSPPKITPRAAVAAPRSVPFQTQGRHAHPGGDHPSSGASSSAGEAMGETGTGYTSLSGSWENHYEPKPGGMGYGR